MILVLFKTKIKVDLLASVAIMCTYFNAETHKMSDLLTVIKAENDPYASTGSFEYSYNLPYGYIKEVA